MTLDGLTQEEKTMALLAHLLGGVLLLIAGFLAWLPSLVIWQTKGKESAFVARQAKEALNFQITALIVLLPLGLITFILMFIFIGVLLVPVLVLLGLGFAGFSVYGGIQANNGVDFRYPFNIRLIS